MAIVIPTVIIAIRMAPQQKGLQALGADEVNNKNSSQAAAAKGITAAVARKSTAFYALLLFFFFITSIGSFGQYVAPFAMGVGYDVAFAGNAMGGWSIGVMIGALAFGALTDRIGARNTAIFAMALGLVPIALLTTIPDNPFIFNIAIAIFGFVVSSIGTLGPLLTTALFGNKEYAQIYSSAVIGLAVAGIIALPAYGYIAELTGSYSSILYAVGVMLIINIVLLVIAFNGKKKLEKAGHWS